MSAVLPGQDGVTVDFVSLDAALKIIYSNKKVVDETYKNRPLHALLPKETDFYGKSYTVDVITSLGQGRSAQFANAQANKSAPQIDQFNIYRAYDYSLAGVDIWTMLAAKGNKATMLEALTTAINGARATVMRSAVISEFRDGTGEIGRVAAVTTGAGGFITLTNKLDVLNFEKNQILNFWSASNASPASDTFYSGTATQYVTTNATSKVKSVDRAAGKVYSDNLPTDGGGGATLLTNGGAHIVTDGDYLYNTTGSGQGGVTGFGKISGLAAWIPSAGPTSTLFMGMDRTGDMVRLAGVVSSQIGVSEDEALLNASQEIYMYGGGVTTHFVVSPKRFNALSKVLGPARRFGMEKRGTVGFQTLEINGQGGVIKVIADPNCPDNVGYGLQLDTWKLKTLQSMPTFLTMGSKTIIEPNNNRVEIRCGYAGNIYTNAPGYNGVVLFA